MSGRRRCAGRAMSAKARGALKSARESDNRLTRHKIARFLVEALPCLKSSITALRLHDACYRCKLTAITAWPESRLPLPGPGHAPVASSGSAVSVAATFWGIGHMAFILNIGKCSLLGNYRENNEDSIDVKVFPDLTVGIVADGMGGQAGEIASKRAVEIIPRMRKNLTLTSSRADTVKTVMRKSIVQANEEIMAMERSTRT